MVLGWPSRTKAEPQHKQRRQPAALGLEGLETRDTPAIAVTAASPQALVQSLLGGGVQAFNVSYTGAAGASGQFTGGTDSIGFEKGVILSSGAAADVVGPNKSESTTTIWGTPGDAQLTAIAGTTTNDASVLEFDFIPKGSILSFQYVFGSDEYNEFANGSFNDVFAFLLNGTNVALLPDGTAVTINNVNGGNPFGTGAVNPQFYRNNSIVDPGPATIDCEMDGLTVVLTVKARVNAGQVNHIKLAVADAFDSAYDSNVFIRSGSFSAGLFTGRVFFPLRYIHDRASDTYRGNLTLVNTDIEAANGPIHVVFTRLPQGVQVLNAAGTTAQGQPYVTLDVGSLGARTAGRIPLVLANPLKVYLSTFLQGFDYAIVQGVAPT